MQTNQGHNVIIICFIAITWRETDYKTTRVSHVCLSVCDLYYKVAILVQF